MDINTPIVDAPIEPSIIKPLADTEIVKTEKISLTEAYRQDFDKHENVIEVTENQKLTTADISVNLKEKISEPFHTDNKKSTDINTTIKEQPNQNLRKSSRIKNLSKNKLSMSPVTLKPHLIEKQANNKEHQRKSTVTQDRIILSKIKSNADKIEKAPKFPPEKELDLSEKNVTKAVVSDLDTKLEKEAVTQYILSNSVLESKKESHLNNNQDQGQPVKLTVNKSKPSDSVIELRKEICSSNENTN
ncbi:hypothetical protein OnM2_021012 [Erysiphe neolycopersici]|uniref:Uncharacterized protein n=1 Tax=Erysiphe neolycopersici TaxID=212602 RepID=A0A420I345_9PEZI|nr:hypothetical protein OnM2_021012 [Erysiphe neolycopersici]